MENLPENKKRMHHILKIVIFVLIIICAVKILVGDNSFDKNKTENTISFTGHGEVSAVPDIATLDFTISKDAKTVKESQAEVAKVEKEVLAFLRTNKVEDKDIKAVNNSFYPKYEFQYSKDVACGAFTCPPRPSKEVIVGYTASENITVKIRNTDDVGKISEGLGALAVSNLNGPNFSIDKEDALKDTARKLAIDDAKAKAKILAKDLGVRLGKITSFSEGGNYPTPMYVKTAMMDNALATSAQAELPKGENLITSDITITYEIR